MKLPDEVADSLASIAILHDNSALLERLVRHCAQVAELAVDKYISGTKAGLIARQAVLRECGLEEE